MKPSAGWNGGRWASCRGRCRREQVKIGLFSLPQTLLQRFRGFGMAGLVQMVDAVISVSLPLAPKGPSAEPEGTLGSPTTQLRPPPRSIIGRPDAEAWGLR